MGNQVRYYHGGIRGLKQGDKILPPSVTGKSNLLQYAQEIAPDGPQRSDRVYLTTDKNAARMYASIVPRGDIYEVIPDGELEHDPDCKVKGYSFQCESATIRRAIELSVSPSDFRVIRHIFN